MYLTTELHPVWYRQYQQLSTRDLRLCYFDLVIKFSVLDDGKLQRVRLFT